MANRVGLIVAELQAKSAEFQKGLKEAESAMTKTRQTVQRESTAMQSAMDKATKGVKTLGAAFGVSLSVAGAVAALKAIGGMFDRIADGADQANVSIRDFQVLDYVARNNNSSVDVMTTALNKLEGKLGDAVNGSKEAKSAITALGVTVGQFEQMTGGERLALLGHHMNEATDKAGAFGDVAELIGETNLPKLRVALQELGKGFQQVGQEAEASSQIFTDAAVKQYDAIADWVGNFLKGSVVGLVQFGSAAMDAGKSLENLSKLNLDELINLKTALSITGGQFYNKELLANIDALIAKKGEETVQDKIRSEILSEINAKLRDYNLSVKETVAQTVGGISNLTERLYVLKTAQESVTTAEAFKEYQAAIDGTGDAMLKLFQQMEQAAKTPEEKFKEVNQLLTTLLNNGVITADQFSKVFNSIKPGAKEAAEELKKCKQEIQSLMESLQTPEEKYMATLNHLKTLRSAGMDDTTYNRAVNKATTDYQSGIPAYQLKASVQTDYASNDEKIAQMQKQLQEAVNVGLSQDLANKKLADFKTELNASNESTKALNQSLTLMGQLTTGGFTGAAEKLKLLNEQYAAGKIGVEEYQRALDGLEKNYGELEQLGEQLANTFAKGIADMIFEGKKFGDVLKDLGKQLMEFIAKKVLIEGVGGAISNGILGAMGFAGGGNPPTDQPSVVGENGPELFWPSQTGYVMPNDDSAKVIRSAMGGGGEGFVYNFSPVINGGDRQMIREEMEKMRPTYQQDAWNYYQNKKARGYKT